MSTFFFLPSCWSQIFRVLRELWYKMLIIQMKWLNYQKVELYIKKTKMITCELDKSQRTQQILARITLRCATNKGARGIEAWAACPGSIAVLTRRCALYGGPWWARCWQVWSDELSPYSIPAPVLRYDTMICTGKLRCKLPVYSST